MRSEIALRTSERRLQKAHYLALRPKGAAIVPISNSMRLRKWLEICCDLVSPTKRSAYATLPGWKRLCDAWTPELRAAWLDYGRPTAAFPLGRLMQDKAFPQAVWDALIKPVGVEADLPYAPEADVRVSETWLWSSEERKRYFIVVNEDSADAVVEGWGGDEERDAVTWALLPALKEGAVRDPKINVARVSRKVVPYETDIGLAADTIAKISEPDTIVHPRFDKPVAVTKFVPPTLTAVSMEL